MAKKKFRRMTPKAARRRVRKMRRGITERRKKEYTYRGYTLEELREMPIWPSEEDVDALSLVEILPSRARRSLDRASSPEFNHLLDKIHGSSEDTVIRTHRRDMLILPSFVGRTIEVYNGRDFNDLEIKPEMIGHFLGEFSITRSRVVHTGPGVGATRSSKFMPLK